METPTDPTPVAAPASPAQAIPRWKEALKTPAVRVGLVAALLLLAVWIDARLEVAGVRQEVARRLSEGDTLAKEGRSIAKQNADAVAALQAKVGALEAKLAETQSQAVALEAMYQELSSSRDERLLAEVEQAVSIAMQQLQFAGNVEAALIALQGADARLARSAQPQFIPVRKLLTRDIERLKATPGADVTGLSLKIESVVAAADSLPLAYEQRPKPDARDGKDAKVAAKAPGPADSQFWRDLGAELWREVRQLIRVERIDHGDPALLSPNQAFFLRENLKLRLLNARLALLQRDSKTFREEIRQAREQLERYFDGRAKPVQSAQATLKTLAATDVSFDLPGLAETSAALRNIKIARERGTGR